MPSNRFLETDRTDFNFGTMHIIEDTSSSKFYVVVAGRPSYPISVMPKIDEGASDSKAIVDALTAVATELKESNRLAAENAKRMDANMRLLEKVIGK